jgi:hypothetical protein
MGYALLISVLETAVIVLLAGAIAVALLVLGAPILAEFSAVRALVRQFGRDL